MSNSKENLIPLNKRTKAEQREIARLGGIASGVARRKKKTLADSVRLAINSTVTAKTKEEIEKALGQVLEDDEATLFMTMVLGQIKAAQKGSTKAFEKLYDIAASSDEHAMDEVDDILVSIAEVANE